MARCIETEPAARACATCPYRQQNQTAEARKTQPRAEGEQHGWYDVANVRRLWKGAQDGNPTVCHAVDPNAPEYGGRAAKPGHERLCVGQLILVARAMNIVNERSASMAPGRAKPWTGLFTRAGMLEWIERLMFRGTALGLTTEALPTAFDDIDDIRLPWDDPILNDCGNS